MIFQNEVRTRALMGDLDNMEEFFVQQFSFCMACLHKTHQCTAAGGNAPPPPHWQAEIDGRDNVITQRDATIATHVATIAQRDASIAEHVNFIGQRDATIASHVATIGQRDVIIETHERRIESLMGEIKFRELIF